MFEITHLLIIPIHDRLKSTHAILHANMLLTKGTFICEIEIAWALVALLLKFVSELQCTNLCGHNQYGCVSLAT